MGFVSPQIEDDARLPAGAVPRRPGLLVQPDPSRGPASARGDRRARRHRRRPRSTRSTACGRRRLVRWVHDTSTPVFDEDGALDHFLGLHDRHHRAQARGGARLRSAEERYRLLVERTPAIAYTESIAAGLRPGDRDLVPEPADRGDPRATRRADGTRAGLLAEITCIPDDRERGHGRRASARTRPASRTRRSTG